MPSSHRNCSCCPPAPLPRPCSRGANCSFAHGESELRSSGGSTTQTARGTAEGFSPAPPPPAACAPSSSASSAGEAPAGSGGSGAASGAGASGGQPEVQGGIAAEELDEAYALQLQYDEQRSYKEKVEQAQREWEAGPEAAAEEAAPPPPGTSYAAKAVAAAAPPAAAPAVTRPPPGLSLPRLDSEAAFPSLQAAGGKGEAHPAAGGSRPHSRAPSSGSCSAAGGSGPVTGAPGWQLGKLLPINCMWDRR